MKKSLWFSLALVLILAVIAGCAAALQNYDKVTLGMSKAEVKQIAGEPHRIMEGESTGEGPLISKAGKHEIWFYRDGILVFMENKLVSKGHKVQ
jgi:hypothetical protein